MERVAPGWLRRKWRDGAGRRTSERGAGEAEKGERPSGPGLWWAVPGGKKRGKGEEGAGLGLAPGFFFFLVCKLFLFFPDT